MAYNVTTWRTKKLDNLRIPVASLFENERHDWHPGRINHDDGSVTFSIMESVYIKGQIENNILIVEEIHAESEGSGTALWRIIEPALEQSTGTLIASRVWEGGDEIDRLTVEDGKKTVEKIGI